MDNSSTPQEPNEAPSSSSPPSGEQSGPSISPKRRARLQRSERLQSDTSFSPLEALIRDSFGQIVWPIRITSWESVNNNDAATIQDAVAAR